MRVKLGIPPSGIGLSVSPTTGSSSSTATIKWAAQLTTGDSPLRSGTVTFTTVPDGVTYVVSTSQLMGPYYLAVTPATAWANVANTATSTTIGVLTGNLAGWSVAASTTTGLSAAKTAGKDKEATLTWAAQAVGALARSGSITFTPNPAKVGGVATVAPITITTNQKAGPAPTLTLSSYAPGVTVPRGGGTYYTNVTSNFAWTASGQTNVTLSRTTGPAGTTAVTITVPASSLTSTRSVSARFTTNTVPSGATAAQTWSGTQESARPPAPAGSVDINGTYWALSNAGSATWYDAPALCPFPWRLPSETDFSNLINSGQMSQVTGISSGFYWSSTTYPHYTSDAYFFSNGNISNNRAKTLTNYVRCCQ